MIANDGSGGGPPSPAAAYAGRVDAGPREAAAWSARRVLVTNLQAIPGRAYPRLRGALRERSWLFFEIALPFLTTAAFVLVYRALEAPTAYVGFAVLGGAMTAFWLNVLWSMGAQLYWDRGEGNLELYFVAPVSMMSVLVGMALGGLYMSGIRAAVIVVLGTVVFDVRFAVTDWPLLVAVFLLTLTSLYGLGMLLASIFLAWGREAWHLAEMLQEPVYFLGGMYAPIRVLGPVAGLIIGILPLAVGLDAMRQLTFATAASAGVLPPATEVLILVAMTGVFVLLARAALAALEMRARRDGRLTARWQ